MSIQKLKGTLSQTNSDFKNNFQWLINLRRTAKAALGCYIGGVLICTLANVPLTISIQVAFALFGAMGGSLTDVTKLYMNIFNSNKEGKNDDI